MLRPFVLTVALFALGIAGLAQTPSLVSPYYVFPREGVQHIALDSWDLTHRDTPVRSTLELLSTPRWIRVTAPGSIQTALFKAGELPDPYVGLNSEKHRWVEDKAWYYRRMFQLPESAAGNRLMLCFDGIDYFAKVWVNGTLAGSHEGMFGGPYLDATAMLQPGKQNEIIVEVRAAHEGRRASYQPRNPGKVIKPWVLAGGVGRGDVFPAGHVAPGPD